MKRIHDSLHYVFRQNRLVFWYDGRGEWTAEFEAFAGEGIEKLRVAGNEFGTKVRIVRDPNPEARFLIYINSVRPPDAENWLLDLVLQGHEYKADKASLAIQEAGLPQEYLELAVEHAAFFRSDKRIQALKERLLPEDEARDIRRRMISVLLGIADDDIDAQLLALLKAPSESAGLPGAEIDPVEQALGSSVLAEPFWREVARVFGYGSQKPSLRDFAVYLFRAGNPLDPQVALHPHVRVFLRRWKDSKMHRANFGAWSTQMERELQIEGGLERGEGRAKLGDSDTFELFEKYTLHGLCQAFEKNTAAPEIRTVIQQRRLSFWSEGHQHGYAALEQALEMRELLAAAELQVESVEAGLNRYMATWWRIDRAYRVCTWNLRQYKQNAVMKNVTAWLEKTYVNNFLLPLADRWSDQVRKLATWECDALPAQTSFFETWVRPFLRRGQKVFVIISDALRYEAASDFAERLRGENRWTAEMGAMLASLPSYTQLGMASLLPGREWNIDPRTSQAVASVDGRSATGTPARTEILQAAMDGKAIAIQAEDFLEMNSKTEGRALMRDHEVIYIFHNHIDKVGDSPQSEAKTVDAVEKTFEELEQILRKVANVNGNNMLLTADHGFLFQQAEVEAGDVAGVPAADEWIYPAQRFQIGKGIVATQAVKVFTAEALGLKGDWEVAFPLSLGRFPRPGSGKRYVHGGVSLQEVVVPVVKIHKARTDDTGRVDVEVLRAPMKITTGQVAVAVFQDRAVGDKILPRTLHAGIYAADDKLISEVKTAVFDSRNPEARHRETSLLLLLSHAADDYNGQEVELRFVEKVPGSSQYVTYKAHTMKLQKPFASDFDV